ncbi:17230_t:CDS:2 [Racocetra fulgida]|uniref:17230_t:CDS:1 n=1 Tax=Racocetra fulgida TaxID=60492 RepID=A0A9N8YVK5_9GLOM|nr:17230_t:CDS:2 [Racocetra fulgida]
MDNKTKKHPHQKPLQLQKILIESVSNPGEVIVDPAAGGYSVLDACLLSNRNFLGCDIEGEDGSYARVFDNGQLGALISRVQSASISSGIELEGLIIEKSDLFLVQTVEEMESLLTNGEKFDKKTYLIPKKVVKNSPKFRFKYEPDYLILKKETKTLYITELKDGDNFDTKKSSGEAESLRQFKNHISENVPYKTLILVCCFNQTDKKKIIKGFKNKIKPEEAFTGQEFCELIELLKIEECRKIILEILQTKGERL